MFIARMRVLHVSPYFAPAFVYGGPPRTILGLCKGLQAAGVDVEVFTTTANGDAELPTSPPDGQSYEGVRVRYFPRRPPRLLWNASGLAEALDGSAGSFDVIHIHGLWHRPSMLAARAARAADVPYIVSPRGMLEPAALAVHKWRKRVLFETIERRTLSSAAALHATSEVEAANFSRLHLAVETVVVPNGIDVETATRGDRQRLRQRLALPGAARIVMFMGRVHPIKRLDLLGEAVSRLRVPNVHLVIAGPDEGHRAELEALFASLGVRAKWLGRVDDDGDRGDAFAAADVLALCSDSESFGMAVVEAMGHGVPVVVTQTCPWSQIAEAGAGRWVPQTAAAIASALDDVLADQSLAASMAAAGRRLVADRYTWRAMGAAMAQHYRAISARRQRASIAAAATVSS
jgi:glycosyltransferase involved in cell wall biosynthesis